MKDTIENTIEKALEIFEKEYNRQIILYGPPGTSKTYSAKKIASKFLKEDLDEKTDRCKIIQFHPSYSYEDFVRGIEVETENGQIIYKTTNKILGKLVNKAKNDSDNNYVLIIDEINRAPLSSVLGELIYGLEYRGKAIDTLYTVENDNTIVIPENLYIIGTMNTADRSIGSIDYAVRRRFAFIPLLVKEDVVKKHWEDNNLKEKVIKLFGEVQSVFDLENFEDSTVNSEDIRIGHTYFLYNKAISEKTDIKEYMKYRITYEIKPLIEEYIKDGILKRELKVKKFSDDEQEEKMYKLDDIVEKWKEYFD